MSDAGLQELQPPCRCQMTFSRSLLVKLLYPPDSQLESHLTSNAQEAPGRKFVCKFYLSTVQKDGPS